MDIGKKKVSFPMVANYNSVVRYFVECGLDAQFIMPPKMTRRTLEIGSRYSPDYVCAPFKSTLGSMIDALEAGADTLVMTMGLCRLGYYGELQEQIIRDLGYNGQEQRLSEGAAPDQSEDESGKVYTGRCRGSEDGGIYR